MHVSLSSARSPWRSFHWCHTPRWCHNSDHNSHLQMFHLCGFMCVRTLKNLPKIRTLSSILRALNPFLGLGNLASVTTQLPTLGSYTSVESREPDPPLPPVTRNILMRRLWIIDKKRLIIWTEQRSDGLIHIISPWYPQSCSLSRRESISRCWEAGDPPPSPQVHTLTLCSWSTLHQWWSLSGCRGHQ